MAAVGSATDAGKTSTEIKVKGTETAETGKVATQKGITVTMVDPAKVHEEKGITSAKELSEADLKFISDVSERFKGYIDVTKKGTDIVLTANDKKPKGLRKLIEYPNSIREMSNIKAKLGVADRVIFDNNPQIADYPNNDYDGRLYGYDIRYMEPGASIKIPQSEIHLK